MKLRADLIYELNGQLPDYCLLPKHYQLDVVASRTVCECGCKLRIQWTCICYPVGILLGEPKLRHHIKQCPSCKKVYPFEQFHELVPPHGNYTFDIIAEVGIARYCKYKQDKEIEQELQHRYKLTIPYNTISKLANRFLDNFAATHYASSNAIRVLINKGGGFVFNLDGTCEGGTDVFFVIIEGKSKLALAGSRMAAENVDDIASIIDRCIDLFGIPLGTVRDLSNNIKLAIKKVSRARSLNLLDFICQYHLLEKVGERLCKDKHEKLTQYLRKLKIKSSLTTMRCGLVQRSKNGDLITEKELHDYLDDSQKTSKLNHIQLRRHLVYTMLCWLNDSGADLKGEYFPFDLPGLAYYRRCLKTYDILNKILSSGPFKRQEVQTMQRLTDILAPVRNDETLVYLVRSLEKSEKVFNKFRCVLRFNKTNNKSLLRQHQPVSTIEEALKTEERLIGFRDHLKEIIKTSADSQKIADAKICETYLDKYWDNLLGHVIPLEGNDEPILADRTNHIPEQHFGAAKGGWRRRLGTKKMIRHFQGSRPEELLVSNLASQDYIDVVYGGSLDNLSVYFAKNWKDGKNIRKTLSEKKSNHPMPVSKKILRDPDLLLSLEKGIKKLIGNNSFVFPVVHENSSQYLVGQSVCYWDENPFKNIPQGVLSIHENIDTAQAIM